MWISKYINITERLSEERRDRAIIFWHSKSYTRSFKINLPDTYTSQDINQNNLNQSEFSDLQSLHSLKQRTIEISFPTTSYIHLLRLKMEIVF